MTNLLKYDIIYIEKGKRKNKPSQRKDTKTMKILKAINAIIIALAIWAGASYLDIIADNNTSEPQHADWNLFVIALNLTDGE